MPQLLNQKFEPFISVGIDVGADFSEMAMCLPNHSFVEKKTFRIYHNKPDSLEAAVKKIKKAEEDFSMKSKVFMESTGIYHLPLFCYLINHGFDSHIVNPLITNSSRNSGIRKVKNDKVDAKNIAKLGLDPELQASTMPHKLVMNLRNLTREYYSLSDDRSKQVIKLQGQLRIALPQFRGIFSSITGKASLMVLKTHTSLESLAHADAEVLALQISQASRKGITTARKKAEALMKAAEAAQTFGAGVETNFHLICLSISLIETYDEQIKGLLKLMNDIVSANDDEAFVKHIRLLESMKGIGFLSAVSLMCEIGDFAAFKKAKQLIGYFGIDPSVNQSGNFQGTRNKMSKRGSRIARRVLFMMAVQSIGTTRNGISKNPPIRDYYLEKCQAGKPKMVALGAVMSKLCKIIFAVLRDGKPYVIKTREEHYKEYVSKQFPEVKHLVLAA